MSAGEGAQLPTLSQAWPPPPDGSTCSLSRLYLVFAAVIPLLHVPCRWFADVKARHRESWLRYL